MSFSCGNVFKELHLAGKLCDTVIKVGDVEFKVHKIILCGCSSYFRDLFCSKHSSEQQVYSFPDVSPNAMQLILEYAYTHSVVVTEDNVLELIAGAEQFAVKGIIQACCDFLLQMLCSKNCINIWKLADHYRYSDLRDKAYLYILHHFEEATEQSVEFLQLSVEQLADLIEKDELNVKQENVVFEAVLRWITCAPEKRRAHLAELLKKVRLLLITADYLVDTISKNELVRSSMQCVNMLIHTMKTLRESKMSKLLVQTRLPYHVLLTIGGFDNMLSTDKIELYNPRNDCWVTVHKSEKAFPEFSSCVHLDGNIYCVGGCNSESYLSSVQKFNLASQTWQEVGSMHVARAYVSVVGLNGCLYAIGGCNKYVTFKSAEKFHPNSNQWTLVAPMNESRADAGSTTLHGKVYVCGGFMSEQPLSSAECYNPDTNQWTLIPQMDTPRSAMGVIAYRDQIYLMGGYNGENHLSSVRVYNPRSKQWRDSKPMTCSRSNFGVAVLEDQLYVAGGFKSEEATLCSKVERYDEKTEKWENVQELETPRAFISCCVVERHLHVASFRF